MEVKTHMHTHTHTHESHDHHPKQQYHQQNNENQPALVIDTSQNQWSQFPKIKNKKIMN